MAMTDSYSIGASDCSEEAVEIDERWGDLGNDGTDDRTDDRTGDQEVARGR